MTVPAGRRSVRPCPQCGGDVVQTIHETRYVLPLGHSLDSKVDVVACEQCGFCFNDTACSREAYDRYYRESSKYADPRLSTGAGGSPEDQQRLSDTAVAIRGMAGSTDAAILDIGCGAGGLLDALAAVGYGDVSGMDPAAACATAVCQRGYRGVIGTLDDHSLAAGTFGGIILSHVLEHICDIESALLSVRGLLADDGWLYVEVPDATRYSEYLVAPFQDFNLEHINHFTAKSLGNLLRFHGWAVQEHGAKTLPMPDGKRYPAVYALARPSAPALAEADRSALASLLEYVRVSRDFLDNINGQLRQAVAGREIVVWGVGQLTMRLLAEPGLQSAKIVGFVDSNPVHHGKTLADRPIFGPAELPAHFGADLPIVIGSLVNLASIESSIRSLGFSNPIVCLCEQRIT